MSSKITPNHARLEALYEVSRALNSSLDLDEALRIVVDAALRLTGAERGFLMLFDDAAGELRFRVARGADQQPLEAGAFEVSHSVVQEVARSGQPVVTLNAQADPRFQLKASIVNYLLRSIMAVPLRARERLVGVLYVDTRTRDVEFSPSDLDLLTTFADQAATALINAQLYEDQKRDAEVRRLLLEIARRAQAAGSTQELARWVAENLPGWIGCERCGLFLLEADTQALFPAAFTRAEDARFFAGLGAIRPEWPALAQRLQSSLRPVHLSVADLIEALPTEWLATLRPLHDVLVIPLRAGARLAGLLALDPADPNGAFSPLALTFADILGDQLAAAFQRLELFETAQRQLRELTVLNAVAVAAAEAASLEALTQRVASVIEPILGAAGLGILLLDEAAGQLRRYPPGRGGPAAVPLGQGLVGHVAAVGQPYRSADVSMDPHYAGAPPAFRSELCVPLKVGERVIGVIDVASQAVNAFTAGDERLLITVAGQLATAVEKQRLLETERQQRVLAEALRDVGLGLTLETELEVMLDRLLGHIARVVPYDAACVLLVDDDGVTHTAGVRGYERFDASVAEFVRAQRLAVPATPNLRRMAETGQPVVIPDVAEDPGWVSTPAKAWLRSWVGAPVIVRGRCLAFLSLDKAEPGFYGPDHAQRLAAFSSYAALALQNVRLFEAAKQQAAELDAVRTASLSLTSSLNVREVLHAILRSTLALLSGVQDAHIFLYHNDRLEFGAVLWSDGRLAQPYEPRRDGLTYTVARTGEPIVVPDMRAHPLFANAPAAWRGAIIGLPLKIGARVVGVMNVAYPEPRRFTEGEQRILQLLGEQAAAAIENARLFDATRRQVDELTVLHAVALAGAESIDLDTLLGRVTRRLGEVLGARHFGVFLLDKSGLVLHPHASFRGARTNQVLFGEGIIGLTASTARPYRLADVTQEPAYLPLHPGTLSQLTMPLKANDRVIGVIDAESERRGAFSEDDERLLATVAGQLATAIEKARLFEAEHRAREQAETLRDVAGLLSTTLDRDQLLGLILDQLARLVKYESASIMLLTEEGLTIAAQRGFRVPAQQFQPVDLLRLEHIRAVLDDRQPMLILDTHSDSRWRSLPGAEYIRCWLGVPLVAKDQPIGLLNLDGDRPGSYSPHDAEVALALASQAAVALERLRLLEAAQQHERELAILLGLARAVSSSLDLQAILEQVSVSLTNTLRVEACVVSTYDPATRTVKTISWHVVNSLPGEVVHGAFDLEAYPLTAHVIDQDNVCVVRVDEPWADPAELELLRRIGYGVLLMLSVRASGRPVGLLELYSADPARQFTEADLRLARAIADQTGVAMENARLFQAEREQRELAEALRAAAASLSASLDLDAVLDRLLDQIASVVPYDAASLLLVDRLTQQAWVARHRGFERFGPETLAAVQGLRLEVATTANLRQMVETGQAFVISDLKAYPGWVQIEALSHFQSWAGTPVVAQGNVVAFISLDKVQTDFYQPEHARRLAAFAGQAALALQNARLFEAERRRVAALTTLHDVGLEMSVRARLDLPSLLETLVSGAVRLLETQAAAYYALDATTEVLSVAATHRLPPGGPPQRVAVGEDVPGRVAQTEETLVVGDYAPPDGAGPSVVHSLLGVPILWQGQLLGVLLVLDERRHRFDDADVDVARLFADRAAIAIENVRLYTALEKERQRLELLLNLSQSLASTLNPQEVALRALEVMRAAIGATRAVLYLSEPGGAAVRLARVSGYAALSAEAEAQRVPLGHGVVGYAAQQRRPLAVPDVSRDARWVPFPELDDGIRSAVIVPLLAGDELIGVLSLLGDRERFYQDEHVPLLTAAAVSVALALQNAGLFEAEAGRVHYLTVLNEMTRAAVTTDALPTLLQIMADRLGELTGADACYLTLWDEAHQRTIPAATYGPLRGVYAQRFNPAPGAVTLTRSVLEAGRVLVVDDIHATPYLDPTLVAGLPTETQLGLPLIAGDRRLGAAIIAFRPPHHFTPDEIQRGEQAAGQIALAIARARLFDETRRHADELAIVSDLLRQLSIVPSIPGHFPALAAGLARLTQCRHALMALLAEEGKSFRLIGLDESLAGLEPAPRAALERGLVSETILAGQPEHVADVPASGLAVDRALAALDVQARVTLPLQAGSRVIGALALLWTEPDGYRATNFTLLGQLTDALALAVEKERLLEETLQRTADLEALNEISAALRTVEATPQILDLLVDRSRAFFRAETSVILVPDADERSLVYVRSQNIHEDALSERLPLDNSIAGHVFRTGRPYRTADLWRDPLAHQATTVKLFGPEPLARPALYAPLRSGDAVSGVLAITAVAPRVFTDADLRLLNTIAEVGGNALQRARVLETLEQRVAERTRELARANEQLKELDQLKDQFVSNVSHELRTPLTAIKLHLGLLERRGADVLPRYLPVLQRETERLRRLIEDLLDLSRLRARSSPLQRELHRLDPLLADVLALHSTRAEERQVSLVHAVNPDLPPVSIDAAQMMQVFTNLVSNAVTYTAPGGRVTISSRLQAAAGQRAGVAVAIHNDGPPIPAEDLPHLFARFYRGRTARDSGEPGTGLGLAICKEIVERHGGRIDVASAEGAGTTFTVWLPRFAAADTPPAE